MTMKADRICLEIKDITFAEGKLWRPRYGSLIDYSRAPEGLQIEPAFQIVSDQEGLEIEVVLEIRSDQGVTFELEGKRVKCRLIDAPDTPVPPGLVSAALDGSPERCRLRWNRTLGNGKLKVLRVFCQPVPEDDVFAKVEGGLYLAIIDRPRKPVRVQEARTSAPAASAIQVVGIDRSGRPLYDLFKPEPSGIDSRLELEPAFRAWEEVPASFDITLNLPAPYSGLRFETEAPGKVKVYPHHPPSRPAHLESAAAADDGKTCRIAWRKSTGPCLPGTKKKRCFLGDPASFHFKLMDRGGTGELAALVEALDIDPTVIHPAPCTADGVCMPPPDNGGGRSGHGC
jgi:hypothetical protein